MAMKTFTCVVVFPLGFKGILTRITQMLPAQPSLLKNWKSDFISNLNAVESMNGNWAKFKTKNLRYGKPIEAKRTASIR